MMMLLIAISSALLATGFALECEVCMAVDAVTCFGRYETCSSTLDRCMTTLTEKSIGHGGETVSIIELKKSCGSVYDCTHPATLTSKEYRVSVTTKCCDKNFCNNSTISWERPNPTLNGVTCQSCFAKNSNTCPKKTPLKCSGDETYCVQLTASRKEGNLFLYQTAYDNWYVWCTWQRLPDSGLLIRNGAPTSICANMMAVYSHETEGGLYSEQFAVSNMMEVYSQQEEPEQQEEVWVCTKLSGSPVTVAGCASESMQKTQGRTAFPGSAVTVQSTGSSSTSWRGNSFLPPLLVLVTILWTMPH